MNAIPLLLLATVPTGLPTGTFASADECVLRAARVDCRTDALIALLLNRLSCDERSLGQLDKLVEQLGARAFKDREVAFNSLVRLGPAAKPVLRNGLLNSELEVRAAASRALQLIGEQESNPELAAAAVRVLIRRGDSRAIRALLACLPICEPNSELEAEVGLGLYDLAARSPTVPAEFIAALGDSNSARRAIASCIVARRGTAAERAKVRALLADPVSTVRLRVAQGLLAAGDMAAVPALIALLDKEPRYEAGQADELLRWLAQGGGPDSYPDLGRGDGALVYRRAWEAWWLEYRGKLDFAAVLRQPRRPCLFMASSQRKFQGDFLSAAVAGCDGGFRPHLYIPGVRQVAQVLPKGRLLVVGNATGSPVFSDATNRVMEIDWTGYIYWVDDTPNPQWSADNARLVERLRDGRTHVSWSMQGYHIFLDRTGAMTPPPSKTVKNWLERDQFSQEPERKLSRQVALRFGHSLLFEPQRNRLVECDREGRMVGESYFRAPDTEELRLVFPLLRLGFDDLPGRDFDLQTSIDERIRQLSSASPRDIYLAAKSVHTDFKPEEALTVLPALMSARIRPNQRSYDSVPPAGSRDEIIAALIRTPDEAIRVAIELADSKDPVTRAGAISFLGAYELRRNQTMLRWSVIKKHLHDESARVRCAAAGASSLFRNQREEVAAALQELLDDQERPWPGAQPVGVSVKWALEAVRRTGPAQ
jgi:HEAT repeat protein